LFFFVRCARGGFSEFPLLLNAVCLILIVVVVARNRCRNEFMSGAGEENAIRVAKEAVKILPEWDAKKRKQKRRWIFPSLLAVR
jgi:hypothetical protein